MVTPVNLQLSHWNLEHTAQQTRDLSAMAAQAGRQGETVAAAEHRDISVQAADSSAEEERLGRKKRREDEEQRGGGQGRGRKGKNTWEAEGEEALSSSPADTGKFDLYA